MAKMRRVKFEFDDTSLVSLERLKEQGVTVWPDLSEVERKMATRFKSIAGAERRIGNLQKQLREADALLVRFNAERIALAKLAAKGPTFFNPLDVVVAERIRDKILRELCYMNPDGTVLRDR